MKKIILLSFFFFVLPFIFAQDLKKTLPLNQWGFLFGFGVMQNTVESHLRPKGGLFQKATATKISDLQGTPEKYQNNLLLPSFRAQYRDKNGLWEIGRQQKYFIGIKRENRLGFGKLSTSVGYGFSKQYEDLFTVGVDRKITVKNRYGWRIDFEPTQTALPQFFRFDFHLSYGRSNLDRDQTSQILDNQNQRGLLERSGLMVNYGVNVRILILNLQTVRSNFEANGRADAYESNIFNANLIVPSPSVFSTLGYTQQEKKYKAQHPVFNQIRKDNLNSYRWMSVYSLDENSKIVLLYAQNQVNSNIKFYDEEFTTLSLFYNINFS